MVSHDLIDILLALLALAGPPLAWYLQPRFRRRRDQAEARAAEFQPYQQQIDSLMGNVERLWHHIGEQDNQIGGLDARQDELVAHIDDLYAAIGTQPQEVQAAIKSHLTTDRPGARPRKRKPAAAPATAS